MSMECTMKKVVIIGSGIAGLTCAIYTARAGLETVIITGNTYGGCLSQASWVENFPGYADGVAGNTIIDNCIQQAEKHGVDFIYDTVVDTHFSYEEKYVTLESGDVITGDYFVIATGTSHKKLNIPSEDMFLGKSVHFCAVCDGSLYGNQNIVGVVGGGESAFQDALYLSKTCAGVHIFIRKDKARVCTTMLERAMNTKNIIIHYNTTVDSLYGGDDGLLEFIYTTENGVKEERRCDGLFLALGHYPQTRVFRENSNVTVNRDGYIPVDNLFRTSTDKVYAIGDCTATTHKQAVIAAGSGATCAMDIITRG